MPNGDLPARGLVTLVGCGGLYRRPFCSPLIFALDQAGSGG